MRGYCRLVLQVVDNSIFLRVVHVMFIIILLHPDHQQQLLDGAGQYMPIIES